MTATDDAELVGLVLMMLCVPRVTQIYTFMLENEQSVVRDNFTALWILLIPVILMWFVMVGIGAVGAFVDSGGFDV